MKRLTLSKLGSILNINKATIHNWENGVPPRGLEALIKLADFFGISLTEFALGKPEQILHHSILDGNYVITIKKVIAEK